MSKNSTPKGKRPLAELFQHRLHTLFDEHKLSVAAGARKTGIDRTTLSQLLSSTYSRLPRAETVATLARTFDISSDWLLGLSEDRQQGMELIESAVSLTTRRIGPHAELLADLATSVPDSKIRYVSAVGVPDNLKTDETLIFEYGIIWGKAEAKERIKSPGRAELIKRRERDFETCASREKLVDFAEGTWIWRGLPAEQRRSQLLYMADEVERLYPNMRLHIFDERQQLTTCFYVFGNKAAVLVADDFKMLFSRDTHIQSFTSLFDLYIRHTVVHPHEAAGWLRALAKKVA